MAEVNDINVIPVVIANGQSLSPQVNIGTQQLVGIAMPAGWDAAGMTFQASPDGGQTFGELQDGAGAAVSFTVSAGIVFQVDPTKWRGLNCLKVRSGTSGAPVAQTAARAINLITRTVA